MAIKVSRLDMWSGKIADRPGGTAAILEPLAKAKVDLQLVLARPTPEDPGKGVIFVSPIKGAAPEQAATAAGLNRTRNVVGLRIEGAAAAGLGYATTKSEKATLFCAQFSPRTGPKSAVLYAESGMNPADKESYTCGTRA